MTTNNTTLEAISNENLENKTTTINNTTLKIIRTVDDNNNQTINFLDKNATSTATSTLHSSTFISETSNSIELNQGGNPDEEKEDNLLDDPKQVEKDTEVNESDKSGSEIEQNGAENIFDQQPADEQNIAQNKNPKDDSSSQKFPENNS